MDHRSYLFGALILLLTVVAYHDVWHAGFVYEDHNGGDAVLYRPWEGPAVEWQRFATPMAGGLPGVRFFSSASLRLNAALSTQPRGFHVVNVLVHLLNGVLVWLLARPLVGTSAVLVMGLFLLHPLQTESVAAIANRSELVAVTCALLALLVAIRGPQTVIGGAGVVVFGLAAFWTKETTASGLLWALPLLTMVSGRARWRVPVAVWGAGLVCAAWWLRHSPEFSVMGVADYAAFVIRQLGAVLLLLQRTVFPFRQTIDLDLAQRSIPVVWCWLVGAVIVLALWADRVTARGVTDRDRWLMWGLVWTVGCVAVRLIAPQPEHLHEHAWYLPLVGLSLAWVACLTQAPFQQELVYARV